MMDNASLKVFLKGFSDQFEKFCSSYNPAGKVERGSWEIPIGKIEVTTFRGELFEKASAIYCDIVIDTPLEAAEKSGKKESWADAQLLEMDLRGKFQVLEMNLFPVNPFIPKAYIELRTNVTKTVELAGGTDIFPYFADEEDVAFFAEGMKELCKRHGKSYEELQKARADFFVSKFRKTKVGSHAGIYSFHLEEEDFPFFNDMAGTFFKLYTAIVEKRKGTPFTAGDTELKEKIHGMWAEWVMVEDIGTRFGLETGMPPEALLGSILPPRAAF